MTAKKLFKELREILTKSKGRDYLLVVWTELGADESDGIAFLRLIEATFSQMRTNPMKGLI